MHIFCLPPEAQTNSVVDIEGGDVVDGITDEEKIDDWVTDSDNNVDLDT